MWESALSALQAVIFTLGHYAGNSLGSGVFLTALALRIGLIPLSLRLARRVKLRQARLTALQPELRLLQSEFGADPMELHRRTMALFQSHGYQPVDVGGFLGGLLQVPPLSAMFAVLRRGLGSGIGFAWIPNLAATNLPLVGLVVALTAVSALLGAPAEAPRGMLVASAVLVGGFTAWFLLSTSSAMALSVAASSLVGGAQGWWLRRERGQRSASAW